MPRFRARLIEDGTLDAAQADAIADQVRDEMQSAVEFAWESPLPDPSEAVNHVYA